MQSIPTVQLSEAQNFAKVWKQSGLYVPLTDTHTQFATDFANVVLRSFIEMCKQQQALAALKMKEEAEKKKLVIQEG